jgi:hypothetical protein
MPDRPTFEITIVDTEETDCPPIIRLRIVLKRLLRQFGYRCTWIREIGVKSMTASDSEASSPGPESEVAP